MGRVEMTDEELQDRYRVTFSKVPQGAAADRNNPESRFFFFFDPKFKCDIYGSLLDVLLLEMWVPVQSDGGGKQFHVPAPSMEQQQQALPQLQPQQPLHNA